MGKIDRSKFSKKRETITQDDFDGDVVLLTVAGAEEVELDDRNAIVLTFDETGEKVLWLNATQLDSMIERLGDDTDQWIGKVVPVEKTTTQYKGKTYDKVSVVLAKEWDEFLPKPVAKTVAKKK